MLGERAGAGAARARVSRARAAAPSFPRPPAADSPSPNRQKAATTTKPCLTYSWRDGLSGSTLRLSAGSPAAADPRDQRAEEQAPDALAPELGEHADRELRDRLGEEAVAGRRRGEVPGPRGADRFVTAIERDHRGVAGPAPTLDIGGLVRIVEERLERRALVATVVAPVHRLVEHLEQEHGIGARAQAKHAAQPRVLAMMRRAVFTLRSRRLAVVAVACCVLLAACGGGGGGDGEGSGGASTGNGRHDSTTVAPTRAGQAIEWSDCGDIECRDARGAGGSRRSRRARRSISPSAAVARRVTGSGRCSSIRAGPGARGDPAGAGRGVVLLQRAPRSLRHRRVGPARRRRQHRDRLRRTSSTTSSTPTSRRMTQRRSPRTSPPRTQARERRARNAARRCSRTCRPARPSTTWTRSAPRSARRSSPTSASRTARISARCTPTRIRPTCGRSSSTARSIRRSASRTSRATRRSGFDSALERVPRQLRRATECGFGGSDPHRAYDRLIAQIDAEPLPGEVGGEQRTLGPGEADLGVGERALRREPRAGSILTGALERAATRRRLDVARSSRTPTPDASRAVRYDNSQAAFFGIGCLDAPAPTIDQLPAGRAAGRAGRAGVRRVDHVAVVAVLVVAGAARRVSPRRCTGPGAPPIVVLGTSNDPATPLKWAQALARPARVRAPGRVPRARATPRTAAATQCIDDAVDDYLDHADGPAGRRCAGMTGVRSRSRPSMRIALPRTIL